MVTVVKEETAAKKTNPRESFVRKRGNALKQETQNELERFRDYLREQEKSSHTIEKYCRDVRKFLMFVAYVLHTADLKVEEGITYLPLYMTGLL